MAGTYLDDKTGLPLLQAFIPTGFDLTDRGLWDSTFHHPVEHHREPGNQVFTIEWANAGMYEEISDSVSTSFVNIQVRLFEANGVVEFHYGPSLIEDATLFDPTIAGPILAFHPFSYAGNVYALDGDPHQPHHRSLRQCGRVVHGAYLLSHPADGTVYRWGPTEVTLDVSEAEEGLLQAYPNPTLDQVRIDFAGHHAWTLTDALGREVMTGTAEDGLWLDLEPVEAGTFVFRLDDGRVERLVRH